MTERQAAHLQALTTALMGLCDATDASLYSATPPEGDEAEAVELARDIARRVIVGESYDMAEDAVRAEWAAARSGPIA